MLTNITIGEKLLGLFFINLTVLLVIVGNGYTHTKNSVINFKEIEEKVLPISNIHIQNLYLLETIMNSFVDVAVTNEKDILINILNIKSHLLKNLQELVKYEVDIEKQKNLFKKYFDFAYAFTLSVIDNKNKYKIEDAAILKGYSNQVIRLFRKKKIISQKNVSNSLAKISNNISIYFNNSLIFSSIGLIVMLVFGIVMNRFVKNRFATILVSLNNLLKEKPDFSVRLYAGNSDEIGQLTELYNQLSDKLETAHNTSSQNFLKEIEDTQKEVVFTMGSIAESRSKETCNHVRRVAEYSKLLALYYGLNEDEAEMLKQASPMHDIGKVAIPDSVLNKSGTLDDAQRKIMDEHVNLGYEMLKHSKRPLLKTAAIVALQHHEKWDGTGYPKAKKGSDIHIYGRITALADVFDALGSDRVYKKAWEDEKIFDLFREERGKHFDPNLVDIFFEKLEDFLAIRDTFKDEHQKHS